MIIGNRYEILEKIGAGGMAEVYKARCRLLNRFVAVKMLREEFNNDVEFLKRFETEAQAAASLSHPNIVSVYDVGIHDNIHYIVMEYVEGETLKDYMQLRGKLSQEEIVDFSSQIASALEHAHSKKIVHHDIKPHNIIITDSGLLKVTDFGLARAVSATTKIAGSAIGSVHYSSPEQSRGGFTDEKSDIYSLGITMYEMATGILPFDGDTPVAVAMKHLEKKPEKPSYYNPDLPQYIENIILKAIEKEPRNRYQSATELLEDLRNPEKAIENVRADDDRFNTVRIPEIVERPRSAEDRATLQTPSESRREVTKKSKEKKKKEDSVAVVTAVITTIIIVAVFGIVLAHMFSNGIFSGKIEVPDFTGMTVEEATAIAKQAGFEIVEDGEEFSEEYEEGKIISQDPRGGHKVMSAGQVRVVISRGNEGIVLKDYSDWKREDAIKDLRSLGLSYTVEETNDDDVEEGKVIGTSPAAKSQVADGSRVIVYVSLGAKKDKTLPSVIGRTLSEAKEILEDNSVTVGNVTYQESDAQKGTIIRQSPVSGSKVIDGSSVDIVISDGKSSASTSNQQSQQTTSQTENNTDNSTSGGNTGEVHTEVSVE